MTFEIVKYITIGIAILSLILFITCNKIKDYKKGYIKGYRLMAKAIKSRDARQYQFLARSAVIKPEQLSFNTKIKGYEQGIKAAYKKFIKSIDN